MFDHDMAAVDPERRRETARRIAILNRYLGIEAPDAGDDASHAEEMGVGVLQFLRLVRVWSRHRRPEILPGAGGRVLVRAPRETERPKRDDASATLVIDDVAIDLPVRTSRPRARPVLQLLLDGGTAGILAWRLGEGRMTDATVARMLLTLPASGRILEEASLPAGPIAGLVGETLQAAGVAVRRRLATTKLGVETRRLLGSDVAGFALKSREHLRGDARASLYPANLTMIEAAETFGWRLASKEGGSGAQLRLPRRGAARTLQANLERIAEGLS